MGVPADPFVGENVTFTLRFDNTHASLVGYGPYIDLILPATGADGAGAATDDGITFLSATYLGAAVTAQTFTFPVGGTLPHPYARNASNQPITVSGTPGHQLVVLQLPFGSFTPTQPPADITVNVAMSNLADVGTALQMQTRGGFQYGADALDNAPSDPSIIQAGFNNANVTPTLIRLRKTYIGPEDETATGPNFPRQYRIDVDVATGQTIQNLAITDLLPNNLQYLSVISTLINGGASATTSTSTPSTTTPGGTLTRTFTSNVTGNAGTTDATMIFSFFVPRVDASPGVIINANTGDDVVSNNEASSSGLWDPIDGRDPQDQIVTANGASPDHVLTDKSIAIQKSVTIFNDTGVVGPSPGDTLEYTLSAQISDYFAFQNLVVRDTLGDGLREDGTFTPTLAVSEHGAPSNGNMNGGNFSFAFNSPSPGETLGTFEISNELVTRTIDGQVLGGCVPQGGTAGPVPDCTLFNSGGTTITIVYRAIIQDDYAAAYPSGDPSVDEGDVLVNTVEIEGDVLNVQSLAPTGSNELDDSAEEVQIQQGTLTKEIYAINGSTTLPVPLQIGPGDTVTYRLTLTLPTSDIEPLEINDFLPLPIFDATTVTTFNNAPADATVPPSGTAKFGPSDTFFAESGITPVMGTNATGNSITWNYVEFDSPTAPSTVIDLLFTVTASNDPFADGLYLTNQANAVQDTTQLEATTRNAIVQIQLTEPDVQIGKGVVSTDNTADVYAPTTVGPVAFNAPGTAGARFAGTINSTNLAATPINSNVSAIDAGDLVTFAIVLENRGSGVNGAFDVRIRDTMPTGFQIPVSGAGLNLRVVNGAGVVITPSMIGTGLFDPAGGIELPDTATGSIGEDDPSTGANIIIITYDLELTATVAPEAVLTNTATLFNFAGAEGAPDHTTVDRTDDATVTIPEPGLTKTITSTNQAHTAGTQVAVGEQITYDVVVRVPEGEASNFELVDTLASGLAIVSLNSLTPSSGDIATSVGGGFAAVLSTAQASGISNPGGASPDNDGRRATLNFGTLTNSNTDDATAETITLNLTAVVVNASVATRGASLGNSAQALYTGGSATSNTVNVTVVEPGFSVTKLANPTTGDAGDDITFTVTVTSSNVTNTAIAHDVELSDLLPAGLTFQSAVHTAGLAPDVPIGPAANGFTAGWTTFATGTSSTFTVVGTLGAVASGQVLTNTANVQFTSLPTDVFGTQSTHNSIAVERTGNVAHHGGSENDYRAFGNANVTGNPAVPTKTIVSTNVTETAGNNVAVGELVQYEVVVQVPEGVNNSVTLVDILPLGMVIDTVDNVQASSGDLTTSVVGSFATVLANAQGSGVTNGGRTLTFNLGTLTNSDSDNGAGTPETITFTYTAVVLNATEAVRGASLANTATWSSSGSSAPVASPPSVIVVEPALQVTKTVTAPATGDAGDVKTFTLVVSHTGLSDGPAFNAIVRDVIPAGMTYVPGSATYAGGVTPSILPIDFTGGAVVATYDTLLLGETSTITFQATLNASPAVTPGATITNTATVRWTSLPGSVLSPQSPQSPVSTERTGNPLDPGGGLNNYGADDSEDVTVHESSLAGFVYVDSNNNGVRDGGEPGISGVNVRLTGTDHLGNAVDITVPTNGSGAYSFTGLRPGTYQVRETQPAGYTDGLDSIGTPTLGSTLGNDIITTIAFPTGTNTNATDYNFGEVTSSELSITKTGTPHTVLPGGQIVYTLVMANDGPNAAVNAVMTDPLPGGTTFVALSAAAGWSCSTPAVGTNGIVSCTNASFAVGSQSLTLTVQADAGLSPHSVIHNVATITSSSADIKPENNRDDERTVIAAAGDADLGVTKVDDVDPVQVGQNVTYTITVTNHGPATATGVTVTDPLPAGLTFVSSTWGGCVPGTPIVCSVPDQGPGSSFSLQITATATAPGTVTNTATVTGSAPDPNPSNDQDEEPTTIINAGELDLSIVKTGPATVARGATLVYTHVIRNNGATAANSVAVTDPLAIAGLTFLGNSGDCTVAFPCAIGTMNPGDTRTIVSTYAVDPAYAGPDTIVNTSTVSTPDAESNLTNNTSQWTTRVFNATDADLSIVKLDSPDATVAGTLLNYTLIVTNNGPATSTAITVNDTLPTGVTLISSTISTGGSCTGTTSISCPIASLGVGGVATIAMTVQTPSALPTPNPMVNNANVTSSTPDPEPSNDTTTQPTTIVAQADVQITKVGQPTVIAGNQLAYTITVTNNGPSDALDVNVTDTTPAGLVFVSNSGACTTAFPCALGTVPAGQSRIITATFQVPSSYTGPSPIVNTSDVTTSTTETNLLNNTSTANTTLLIDSDLGITKTGPATIEAGNTIVYTTVITNNGPSDAVGVSVADPTPANLVFSGNAGDCVSAFPCNFVSIPAGESRTITSSYLVPSNYTTPDPIQNVATVSSNSPDSNPANNTDDHLTTLGPPSADLAVVKSGPATTIPGDPIVYTITVTNNGPSDAANVELTDPTPANLTFVSNAGACITAFPCALGMIPAGQSRVITATFMVPANYTTPSQITNIATVTTTTTDPNPANNTSTAISSVGADLVVTKVVDNASPNVTEVVNFTVTLRNAGPSATTGVALVDTIPAGLTLLSATPSVGAYDATSGTWTVGALAVNQTVTIAVQARVDASGGITNTATVTASDLYDPNTSNNTAGAALNVPNAADLQVQKTVDRAAASVDTNVTFTITVHNAGPDAATNVELTDVLPAGLSFVNATPSVGSYNPANGIWTVGSLALNGTATLTMTARVDTEGSKTNIASVTRRDQFDPAPANDASGVAVNGLAADVQVVKTVDRTSAGIGDAVTFTITVTNNGPGEATAVRVRDALPSAFAFVSSSSSQGLYIPETGIWTVGGLGAPGSGVPSSATMQITAVVVATGGANTATVMGLDQPDPNPANDVTSVAMDGGAIDLEAGLTFIGDGEAVGKLFDFFVNVTNVGLQPAGDPLTVAIPFPAELAFNAPQTSWPCEAIGRTLFCEHALDTPLNQAQSKSLGYWADVLKVFPRGLAAYAHVLSTRDPNVANNLGSVLLTPPTPAGGAADLRISQTIVQGGNGASPTVTYRVEVENAGPGVAHEVTLIDMLSAGLGLVSITPEDNNAVCVGSRRIACTLGPNGSGTLTPQQRVALTIVAQVQPTAYGLIAHTVSVSGREPDADLATNATRVTFVRAAATNPTQDSDGDVMTDLWESQMGLDPSLADANGDPDSDGVNNATEFAQGTHPRGFHRQFFAEGAANAFFGTMFSLVNPSATHDAMVTLGLMRDTGEMTTTPIELRAMHRQDAAAREMLGTWQGSFSTLIESDQPIASHRLMWWDDRGYGTTLEAAASAPSTRWLFAEGATHGFNLFYLLQNQHMTQAAQVTIRYLLPSGTPVVKEYTVQPHSRETIYVNEIPELAGTDVSAEILSTLPIVAERAMYRDTAGQVMAAGHVGGGATAPQTTWLFAEGATGDFLNLFLLLANPGAVPASVEIRYLLPDGTVITRPYSVAPNSRRTVDVANEDPRLAATSVGMTVTSTQPIVAERAMWWPGRLFAPDWYESHVVLGATEAGTKWALATGASGGALAEQTFVLVANQANTAGTIRVTAVLDDGTTRVKELGIAANARMTLDVAYEFPDVLNHAFSVIVESIGASPVPLVVEGSRYASPGGQLWGSGGAALATRLQ